MLNRRKTILLNPKFQLSLLGYFMALSVLSMAIYYGAVHYFFTSFHEMGTEINLSQDHVFFKFLAEQKRQMDLIFLGTSIVNIIALISGGLIISHKIAGPIYRLTKFMTSMTDGKMPTELNFRDGDFFLEVPKTVNRFLREKGLLP